MVNSQFQIIARDDKVSVVGSLTVLIQTFELKYQKNIMPNQQLLVHLKACIVLCLAAVALSQNPCPLSAENQLITGSISVGLNQASMVRLSTSEEVTCYNYTLQSSFSSEPTVSTALTDFNSQYDSHLFLTVKPTRNPNDDYSYLRFLLRTPWLYTRWNSVRFNFLAEAREDFETGIFQIQTDYLGGCENGKNIEVFLPFHETLTGSPSALLFLTGFQISTEASGSYSSPFEIQQNVLFRNRTGVSISVSVTSVTKLIDLTISYVAFDSRLSVELRFQEYVYDQYFVRQSLSHQIGTQNQLGSFFYGLSSFIISQNRNAQSISFSTAFSASQNTFSFSSNSGMQYLAFSYLGLNDGPCALCSNLNIYNQGVCSSSCPSGTYRNGSRCMSCASGQTWNGFQCVSVCTGGRSWVAAAQQCRCSSGLYWNGISCVSCQSGQFFNTTTNQCQCNTGSYWNGTRCVICTGGRNWNQFSAQCECAFGSNWNGLNCITCFGGQSWSAQLNTCVCPTATNWNGNSCVSACTNGQTWNSQLGRCECQSGTFWDGLSCATCTGGRFWNALVSSCQCQAPLTWNGNACIQIISCSGGRVWNSSTQVCQCPSNTNWNGTTCVSCSGGRIWVSSLNSCQCPSPQTWNGNSCVTLINCSGGRTWNSSANLCQCPIGSHWSSTAGVCVTCFDSQSYWNAQSRQCECLNGKVYQNGGCDCPSGYEQNSRTGQCQQIVNIQCPTGTVYNGSECVSACPVGFYYNGIICTRFIPDCPLGTFWNSVSCEVIVNSCPSGMTWNGSLCVSSNNICQNDNYYFDGVNCIPVSQRCPSLMEWVNGMCVPISNRCPNGTYYNGFQCIRYTDCPMSNMVWNNTISQCVCSPSFFWNGNECIQCTGGRVYSSEYGCRCASGTFWNGNSCTLTTQSICSTIDKASFNGTHCVCYPGYSAMNGQCVCYGLEMSSGWCNRCHQKPNSVWDGGVCKCIDGYFQIDDQCTNQPPVNPNVTGTGICNVGTYFDDQAKQCLRCVEGCLSCIDCYECLQCEVGYNFNPLTGMCDQVCGDGLRFSLQCDDGNNFNGDGCSFDCRVENGYSCQGGSPNSRDNCTTSVPSQVTFLQTGQSHLYGRIVLNVRLNHLPQALIEIQSECRSNCSRILNAEIVSGDLSATSIETNYIGGAYHSFSVDIDFGREPIGQFTVQISIVDRLRSRYFGSVDASQVLEVTVTPAFLSIIEEEDYLY